MATHSSVICFKEPEGFGSWVITDDPTMQLRDEWNIINSSALSNIFVLDDENRADLLKTLRFSENKRAGYIYTMTRGKGVELPRVAVAIDNRFMNGAVGPKIGIGHSIGVEVDWNCYALEYIAERHTGEVLIEIDANGDPCGVQFGHQAFLMPLFCEFFGMDIDGLLMWFTGVDDKKAQISFKEGVSLSCLVTKTPFPQNGGDMTIQAPPEAEKHLWRISSPVKILFTCAHAANVHEARKRVFRTINRMRRYDDELQYRTDIGYKLSFPVGQSKYNLLSSST